MDRHSQLLPLHHLWMGYMSELLGLPTPPVGPIRPETIGSNTPSSSSMHPKLLRADFHGAVLTVKQSKNSSLVGLSGILIHETENAFKLVTEKNKVKREPCIHPRSAVLTRWQWYPRKTRSSRSLSPPTRLCLPPSSQACHTHFQDPSRKFRHPLSPLRQRKQLWMSHT